MVEKGQPWERPPTGPADWHVDGDDATLAAAVRAHPGARVEFRPSADSDLARALGVRGPGERTVELPIDALRVDADRRQLFAVNMLVVGAPPDRMRWWSRNFELHVTVDGRSVHDGPVVSALVASGQHLRGADVVPRGHPGDGRAELQVYAPSRSERGAIRARLVQGAHLPHPRITQTGGRVVELRSPRAMPLEVDGVKVPPAAHVRVEVLPEAFSLLV
jgi:hypothetical protein